MTIQSAFRMFIILFVFCMPLGVVGMDTDSDDDADETTSSDEEGPRVPPSAREPHTPSKVPATGAKGGWTLGFDPTPASSNQQGTSAFVTSPVTPIRVGTARESTTKPKASGSWMLGINLDRDSTPPTQRTKPSIRILPTTDPHTVYVVQQNVGIPNNQIITCATVSSSTSSSKSSTSRSLPPLRDEYDEWYTNTAPQGAQPSSTPGSNPTSATGERAYRPGFAKLPAGALNEVRSGQNQQPITGRQPTPVRATQPDRDQPHTHRFSVNIGVPLQVIIPVLAAIVVVGWLIKKWHDQPAVVEDEVETGQEVQ